MFNGHAKVITSGCPSAVRRMVHGNSTSSPSSDPGARTRFSHEMSHQGVDGRGASAPAAMPSE